jgi:Mg-chelatase subunit ChlD
VKQFFYEFRDQTQRLENGHRHRLGLISFSASSVVNTEPTEKLDVFEDVVDCMRTDGMTAIYAAIQTACTMLRPFALRLPNTDLRVVVLTDGQNNCDGVSAADALKFLGELGAVCDCMVMGTLTKDADADLLRMVAATGAGRCVEIRCLSDAFEALESPAMVSLAARRDGYGDARESEPPSRPVSRQAPR